MLRDSSGGSAKAGKTENGSKRTKPRPKNEVFQRGLMRFSPSDFISRLLHLPVGGIQHRRRP